MASFPEANRHDVLGLLGMLLERLAVSAGPTTDGTGVSTVLSREHVDGKFRAGIVTAWWLSGSLRASRSSTIASRQGCSTGWPNGRSREAGLPRG